MTLVGWRWQSPEQGKILTGFLWLISGGLFGIGWLYDFYTLNSQIDESNRAPA